ncbi:flagellar associated protein [Raphidocelis subcapitata]|uniref:Flagellar associated protein n=1 Tax=Raphidocelis subcapitata TaxID=307507 RepID=A0A2V0NXC1_9CHLO|nr:flagellar associated protein [Raphidocelis subcapitata]|eukprot:GBF92276.1 flagellar associated protein [Raphidocelis subcapitata]
METPDQKPLLDLEEGAEAEWDRVSEAAGPSAAAPVPTITVRDLIREDPNNVLANIKDGVVKLGEFQVEDTALFEALGDRTMLTMGSEAARIDYEAEWRARLGLLPRGGGSGGGGGAGPGGAKRRRRRGTGWSRMVTAEAFVVRIRNAALPDCDGLIHPLLRRWQSGGVHYSVFGLPAVQSVLEFKWESYGRRALLAEFLLFLTWLVSFSTFLLVWQDEDESLSLRQLLATASGRLCVGSELVSLAAMAPFLLIEWSTLAAYSAGWLDVWNLLDIGTYALQISIAVVHLGRGTYLSASLLPALIAVQCVLLFFRLNYFSRLFANRFSLVDSLKQVIQDVRFYLLFLLLMVFGFACSFHVLFRDDQELPQFSDISHSVLTVLNYALGGVQLSTMLDSSNPRAAMGLSIVYQFSMSMVLMNLLVGVMCASASKAAQHEDLKALLARAQVLDELETTLPAWVERWMLGGKGHPAFVHVLRLDPKSLDSVEGAQLWRRTSSAAADRGAGGLGAGGGGAQLEEVLSEVRALKAQVATLNSLLHTAVPSLPPSPTPELDSP